MHDFSFKRGRLHCENVSLASLAKKHGSPLYVYSHATLTRNYEQLDDALSPVEHLVCYSPKANSNLSVLRTLTNAGSGFDIVSGGELQRVIAAGGDASNCIFAGVGKKEEEIEFALKKGIYSFNVESEPELARINKVARQLKKKAPIAVRVNPNVDAKTHAKITTGTYENKFGIAFEEIEGVYERAARLKHLYLRGIQMHIGSQLTEVAPFEKAVRKVAPLAKRLTEKHGFEFFSIGGGVGIVYEPALESGDARWWRSPKRKNLLTPAKYAAKLLPLLQPLGLRILIEPGRFIAGNAGILITRVEYVKRTGVKNFVIVDAAMNDLARPALYDSYHEIVPLAQKAGDHLKRNRISSDVVGPICESGDYFCKNRMLPKVGEGDYLALLSAGAYGFVMASNYNTRANSAEVLVKGSQAEVVRKRQPIKQLWASESIPKWLQ
ncbi:MAG: diaminopimelate decarboxylase [Verrucomicrobiota bacterium]|jgi:diaminopimelate decarboxylase|nr:diaminopimelate decarboxylase [Verrucomicrobiota bacterium]MDP7049585.1 diaminopimelate decarboxylase [Verrucomicrobiota bacterium]